MSGYGKPILQVALDFERLSDAEKIAEVLKHELSGVEYICEAGTPLIKNEGLKTVIPGLRSIVGTKTRIAADLKTMDAGAFEVELAKKSGADIISVAGVAEEETINSVLVRSKDLGLEVMVDSISTGEISGRLERICGLIKRHNSSGGKAILEYHIPMDVQAKTNDFSKVKQMRDKFGIPIAAAGGLDENTIPKVIGYGASVCVVGGAITRPKQRTSREAVRKIRGAIYGSK